MRKSMLTLCLAFLGALTVQAGAEDSSRRPVETLGLSFSAAFNASDADGVAALFTDDGVGSLSMGASPMGEGGGLASMCLKMAGGELSSCPRALLRRAAQ